MENPVMMSQTHDNVGTIADKIDSMRQKWYDQLKKINENLDDIQYQYMVYGFVIMIMLFFLYIILADFYKTFSFYNMLNKDSDHKTYRNNSINRAKLDNNEDESEFDAFYNTNEYIMDNLAEKDKNMQLQLQRLLEFKRRNNIDDSLHVKVDEKVMSTERDNYAYAPNKKSTPFLEMMFSEPNYSKLNHIR